MLQKPYLGSRKRVQGRAWPGEGKQEGRCEILLRFAEDFSWPHGFSVCMMVVVVQTCAPVSAFSHRRFLSGCMHLYVHSGCQ